MIFDERRARTQPPAPFAGYPQRVRRLFVWYDALSDWQRVKYAGVAILFLLACGGYLLGLGSTMVLQRVEMDAAALAAAPLPTTLPTATAEPIALAALAPVSLTATPRPSPTSVPATALPSRTPFSAPQIAEPRAVPRSLPAAPVPVAPARTPTPDKPRNLETSKPEPPAASILTPTPGLARTALPPTAVRQLTPATKPTSATLPTLALPTTPVATAAPGATRPPPAPTVVRTPPVH